MLRAAILFSLLAIPATASLAAPERQRIHEEDGLRFVYSSRLLSDGLIEIRGHLAGSGESFRYIVDRSGRVAGKHDGHRVRFSVGKAGRDRLAGSFDPAPALADAALAAGPAESRGD